MRLFIDTETRSPVPIKHGVAKYATEAQVILAQWAVDDGPITVTNLLAKGKDEALIAAAEQADEIWAHSAEFDRTLLETTDWWPIVLLEKWRCTAALARMHGLPGGLDKLSTIFKLPDDLAKDKRGSELIQLFCIPQKGDLVEYNDHRSHPKEWREFEEYARKDISAMRAVHKATPKWNSTPKMWAFWHLDQRMNARGVAMDLKLCQGAVDATTKAKQRLRDKTTDMTLGVVESTTQRDRLLAYLGDYGVSLPDLTADTVERRLNDEALPEHAKELLRIRQQASKASTAKYRRALTQHVGGRLRNLLVFCGASRTGRWAGRTLQPQNLPRPKHKPWEIEQAVVAFRESGANLYDPEDVLGLASSCLRGMIVAAPGRRLVISDLANIEGRFMAWIAGEQWKLDAFAAYDRKEGPDLYKVAYARPFQINPNDIADEGDWRRQIGKVMELALQYYGGVGAFCSMAETYHLDLDDMAAKAWDVIPADTKFEAYNLWHKAQKRRRTYGLAEKVWVVCQSLVLMWRAAHPAICQFWKDLEDATHSATHTPGKVKKVGRLAIDRQGNWLRILLPSGRYLCYPAPREMESSSSYLGIDPYTKQWKRIDTYSGKRAENIVQGGCADILMDGLLAADTAGYNPVLSVHDEGICEPPDEDQFTNKALSKLLVESSPWADGLPLAAKGKTLYRYSK